MNTRCHPERSARLTRFFCGSGGRGVEEPLLPHKSQCGRLAQQQVPGLLAPKGFLRLLAALVAQDDTPRKLRALMNNPGSAVHYEGRL